MKSYHEFCSGIRTTVNFVRDTGDLRYNALVTKAISTFTGNGWIPLCIQILAGAVALLRGYVRKYVFL